MNDFAVNIAVMQGIIIEQNINYFILENQYEKELGVITEADQQNKFEAAKNWLKKKINDFIGIIKSWASAVIKFLTKTLPEWLSRQFNKLMVFLHIRQKAETIDNLNAELVKACTHIATVYLRDATALVNDSTKLQTLLINTLSNFLVNGTPVDSY